MIITQRKKFLYATGVVATMLLLMFATNPTSNGFKNYLQEYIQTQSGATLEPKSTIAAPYFQRENYYLFSTYTTTIAGTEYEYLGVFGTFKKY